MLILAIDTSGLTGSVALLDGPQVLAETTLPAQPRSAQTLAPAIVRLLADVRIQPTQVELVATTTGPGSFTGLRVGVTAAKTFAYAVGAQVLGLSTLEVVAHGIPDSWPADPSREVHAVLDAQRRELFCGRFDNHLVRVTSDYLVSVEQWLSGLTPGTIITGSGLRRIIGQLPTGVVTTDEKHWEPRASVVGRLAWRDFQSGRRDDLWKLAPFYLRPSYAEEKAKTTSPPQIALPPPTSSPRSKTP